MNIDGELGPYSSDAQGYNFTINDSDLNITLPYKYQAIFLIINLHNIHLKSVATLTVLYEKLNKYYYPKSKLEIFYNGSTADAFYITSIIFAALMLIFIFILLRNPKAKPRKLIIDDADIERAKHQPSLMRAPNFHEVLLILNILFFIAIVIFRGVYDNGFHIEEAVNKTEFINLVKYEYRFKIIHGLCFLNIIIFFFCLIFFMFDSVPEIDSIYLTLTSYLYDLMPLILCILIPFVMVSFFCAYMMFGVYGYAQYRGVGFTLMKTIQSLFRGSLDHSEFIDPNKNKFKIFKGFESTINYTDTLSDAVGPTGYILFSLLFFFYNFVFIKGSIVAICFLKYKFTVVCKQERELKRKKELEAQARRQKRNEQKKEKEMERSHKKNKEEGGKMIEMQNLEKK